MALPLCGICELTSNVYVTTTTIVSLPTLIISSLSAATSTPTIASITQVGPNQVNVTINEPTVAPNCVTDYIIQYEGGNVSTGGALSVVIEDLVFCQLSTVSFTVTAILTDGSQTGTTSMDLSLIGTCILILELWRYCQESCNCAYSLIQGFPQRQYPISYSNYRYALYFVGILFRGNGQWLGLRNLRSF